MNPSILNEESLEFRLGNFNLVEITALDTAFTNRTEVSLLRALAFYMENYLKSPNFA